MDPAESLWQAGTGSAGLTSGTFYGRFRRYLREAGLAPAGVHITRHTAAKLRRDAGESVEAVSAFLDHSSLAVTTVYLRRLEGVEDRAWADVAAAIGGLNADLVVPVGPGLAPFPLGITGGLWAVFALRGFFFSFLGWLGGPPPRRRPGLASLGGEAPW